MNEGSEITLEQMLYARDLRAAKQKHLIEKCGLPLVSFTVNTPGQRKNTPVSRSIFHEGCDVLTKILDMKGISPVYFEICKPDTGYEAYFLVDADVHILKAHMCQIENTHPLGRLFDFDVIGQEGSITREALGYPKRKCLICGQDAHACARSRQHSVPELQEKILKMTKAYF